MYCKYVTVATAFTSAQVIDDLAKLLTGSPISALGPACDKVNSVLISDVAPGWTLHDAASGSGSQVVKALDADGLTTKYVRIHTFNTIDVYETWNETTHVGTNQNSNTNISQLPNFTSGQQNTLHIFATARTISLVILTSMAYIRHVGEVSRDIRYLNSTTYPAHFVTDETNLFYGGGQNQCRVFFPRIKNYAASGDLLSTQAAGYVGTFSARSFSNKTNIYWHGQPLRDSTEAVYYELSPLFILANDQNSLLIGRMHDVLSTTYNYGTSGDTIFDGSYNYMVLKGSYLSLALRKH